MKFQSLLCSVCLQRYDLDERIPKSLPQCGHTVCIKCLSVIVQDHEPRCPLDKRKFSSEYKTAEAFPTNFTVRGLIEENPQWEVCQLHGERIKLICYTDRCKVCAYCALNGAHREHDVKHIIDVKPEIDERRKKLEKALDNLDLYYKNMDNLLEEKRGATLKNLDDRFKELMFIVRMKKMELATEINTYFDQEKGRLNYNIGRDCPLRTSLAGRIAVYRDFARSEDPFKIIEEDISSIIASLDYDALKVGLTEAAENVTQMMNRFDEGLAAKVQAVTELTISTEDLKTKLDIRYPDIKQEEVLEGIKIPSQNFKVNSSLKMNNGPNYFEIIARSKEAKVHTINLEEWKRIPEVRLDCSKILFTEEDLKVMESIWGKIGEIPNVKIVAQRMDANCETPLLHLLAVILWKPELLQKLEIDFYGSKIGDLCVKLLAERILNRAPGIKVFSLNLWNTNVTCKALQFFSEHTSTCFKSTEDFTLNLSELATSEASLVPLFAKLPSVKHFALGLGGTKITDKGLLAFVESTLRSIEKLDSFEMSLWKTSVTDESVTELFNSMPDTMSLRLSLTGTKITNRCISSFIENKVPKMKGLKIFEVTVTDTLITEEFKTKLDDIRKKLSE